MMVISYHHFLSFIMVVNLSADSILLHYTIHYTYIPTYYIDNVYILYIYVEKVVGKCKILFDIQDLTQLYNIRVYSTEY